MHSNSPRFPQPRSGRYALPTITLREPVAWGNGLQSEVQRSVWAGIESPLAHVLFWDHQKYGYKVFGTLQIFPPGHQRYYLKKVLE